MFVAPASCPLCRRLNAGLKPTRTNWAPDARSGQRSDVRPVTKVPGKAIAIFLPAPSCEFRRVCPSIKSEADLQSW